MGAIRSFVTFAAYSSFMCLPQSCRSFLLLLTVLFFALPVQAQRAIEGHISDKDRHSVSYALVTLHHADSTVAESAMTDSSGFYHINVPALKNMLLKISATGYADQWSLLRDTPDSLSIVDVTLSDNTSRNLHGVMVTGSKPLIERRVDRTVFNVESSAVAAGGDALDALKVAPGVRVNENNISIAGKSTVSVMINDKLLQVSGDELANVLKSIPADNVSRIEIITTPPAKYDAAGNSGLINIVTKKQLKNGLNGTAALSYIQRFSRAGGFNSNLNYRHNKINIYGFANAYRANQMPQQNITTYYPDQRWEQHNDATSKNVFNRTQIGVDYNLNQNSTIGVLYTLGNGGNQYSEDELITSNAYNLRTGGIDSFITTAAHTQDRGLRNVGNINYQWKADTGGRKVNVDLDYFNRRGKAYRNLNTNNFFTDSLPTGVTDITRTSGVQQIDIRSGKIDVEWPLAFARLTFGGKASFTHNTSNNLFEYFRDTTYHVDEGKTNSFDYHENTEALYLSAAKTLGKWELQLGLRGEYTQTKSYSVALSEAARNEYLKLFPTVYLQYNQDDGHAWNLNYSKRINRPDFWDMNPFRNYFTATSYSQGNPFLQPSFSNNLELTYSLHSKYSFTVFAQKVNNLQTRVSFIDTANKSYSFNMANVGDGSSIGTSVNGTFNPAKWWECVLSGNAWYTRFSSSFYGDGARAYSRPGFTVETNNTFYLNKNKTLIANLNFTYNSRNIDDFDLVYANESLEAGIKAMFFQKRLSFAINGFDILRTERNYIDNQYNGTQQRNYWDERTFRFNVTWKFGSDAVKAKRERSTSLDDDQRTK